MMPIFDGIANNSHNCYKDMDNGIITTTTTTTQQQQQQQQQQQSVTPSTTRNYTSTKQMNVLLEQQIQHFF